MEVPEVHYVIADDDVRVAYQDYGSGPPTVLVQTALGHLEGYWEFGTLRRLYERMAANLRILTFDHRGNGMSDGFTEPPSLEDRALDVKAVMDEVGIDRANLFGFDFGAQVAIGFAARYPERVERLVLANARIGPSARSRADALYPEAEQPGPPTGSEVERTLNMVGIEVDEAFTHFSPSVAKYPEDVRLMPRFERLVGSRDVHRRQIESVTDVDVTDIAPLVATPTLVTHTLGDRRFHVGYARLLAELIPDATLLEVAGEDHMFWLADDWREITDAHINFLTDSVVSAPVERRFAVVLFTDIVESTSTSLAAGDDEWRLRLDAHDRISRRVVTHHDGSLVKQTGDGILATFDAPSRAVDTSIDLRDELAESGIRIRAGIHAGEVEVRGDDIAGAVVNLAARVEQAAPEGFIYTTATIRDMLIGSSHSFEPAGTHHLKGFEDEWLLYRIGITPAHL